MSVAPQPAQAHNKHWKESRRHGHRVFETHRHYSYPPHPYGNISFRLPRGFISITVGGEAYHYYDGVYYRASHHGYVVTPPPFGACIKRLPRGYTKIYIDRRPYYKYNEIYYARSPDGYVVIERPEPRYAERGGGSKRSEPEEGYDASFEINIPNKNGGYTTVILKRSGGGFTGPQGEYYEEFPKVDKLQVIYGT